MNDDIPSFDDDKPSISDSYKDVSENYNSAARNWRLVTAIIIGASILTAVQMDRKRGLY